MAISKVIKSVNFKRSNGTLLFLAAIQKEAATDSEVDQMVKDEVQARLDAAGAATAELSEARALLDL